MQVGRGTAEAGKRQQNDPGSRGGQDRDDADLMYVPDDCVANVVLEDQQAIETHSLCFYDTRSLRARMFLFLSNSRRCFYHILRF
jgi:hypothetical protein